jgi:hypothetical protein
MKHAWEDARTTWGKFAVVLFYSLIWFSILSSLWSLAVPTSQGGQCLMDETMRKGSYHMFSAVTRSLNLFIVGFMFYADVGGLKLKNITMVTIFLVANSLIFMSMKSELKQCGMQSMLYWWPGWAAVAWVCMILENRMSDRGTEDERQSLNV